ncbi:hypothetical protein CE91St41_37940 [Oscillospiraceae bacterium]|nr:hypothetical protein CE91St40_37920 [Oscillospiraceae bacterium]BDF76905.1 hypothetical protein CE91St41_37940 [Oscillospiraceae bacterium]
MKQKTRKILGQILLSLACAALGAALAFAWQGSGVSAPPQAPQITARPAPEPTPTPPESAAPAPEATPTPTPEPEVGGDPAIVDNGLPRDKFYITAPRKAYADGGLRLVIPKLGVDVPVLNGVDAQTLLRGVGLYDYAQLPSEGGGNTSIAGHRNGLRGGRITDNMPFYYVNTLTEGDYLYLVEGETVYQYLWECTEVIAPDDWGPIYNRGYACVTLTTCTPIGVADHRLVVRGALSKAFPLAEGYSYPSNTSEEN